MKRRAVFGAVVLSLALGSTAHAQFTPGARTLNDRLLPLIGNGGYDVQHYDLTINYDLFDVSIDGQAVELTTREFEVLDAMARQVDRIVPYTILLRAMGRPPNSRADLRNLNVIVHRLRGKLAGTRPYIIKTVRNRGYGLVEANKTPA